MLGIPHNPTSRIVRKGLLSVRVLLLALLLVLTVAASAQADGGAAGAGEGSGAVATPIVANGAEQVPGGTATPVKAPESVPPAPVPPAPVTTAPVTTAPETVRVTSPPAEVSAPEPVIGPPTPQVPVENTEPVQPVVEAPLGGSINEAKEALRTASVEEAPDSLLSPVVAPATPLAGSLDSPTHGEEAAAEAGGTLSDTVVGLPAVGGPSEPPMAADAGDVSFGAPTHMTAAQRAGALSCELSALGGRVTNNCSTGWLGAGERALSASSMSFAATEGNALAARVGSSGGGGHGGSAAASPPVSPGPGPAPSGASGSAAGATGLALSGFLTLAGLLLLGAPRAMRRLRLSCRPLLTACFVLIPERPG
jgi:hypothetical protein